MRELCKEYMFEANVRNVYDFIMEKGFFENDDFEDYPDFYCSCEPFRKYNRKNASSLKGKPIYGIVINVSVALENVAKFEWIVESKEVAEIQFTKEDTDRCKAELFIETDSNQWFQENDKSWNVPVLLGKSCLESLWQDLIESWDNQPDQDTPQLQNEDGLVKKEFIFDTTPRNFQLVLNECSKLGDWSRISWKTMESKEDVVLELMGFYYTSIIEHNFEGAIKIQVYDYSSEQIRVSAEYNTDSEGAKKFFERLMTELDKIGRFWLKTDTESTAETVDKNGDYEPEAAKKLIQEGAFDGCGMDRETAIDTVDAILWLKENTDKLTVQAIADRANYAREHYYNFRTRCRQVGIEKIKGINVITIRKNN